MYLFLEDASTRSDCTVHSLSWMGKVPDILPNEDGWQLDRSQYYQEGWLATGNARGIVSATFTTCHCNKSADMPPRINFNLRGHRSEVVLVRWNEPYQKLATCDANGVIFVWIRHEGRWSVELINDRNGPVTDFNWAHDGRMALITYQDGFVLVGSVAGQRFWSTMLNLEHAIVTCATWTPDDQKVLLGTSDGQVLVMRSSGAMLTQVTLLEGCEITSMCWSCEKFNMEEAEDSNPGTPIGEARQDTMAVCFKHGDIHLMSGFDDVSPQVIHTGLQGVKVEWSNDGEFLAVGGFIRQPNLSCRDWLMLYTREGVRRFALEIQQQPKPLTALTWGHNDKRLFIATGSRIYVAWVYKDVAPLQLISQRCIQKCIKEEVNAQKLPLPLKLKNSIINLFVPSVKGYIPHPFKLRDFVTLPPPNGERLYCTMIRHGDESSGGCYILYLEYLGGLIPLLKGKRISKIRPEFVIFDPKIRIPNKDGDEDPFGSSTESSSESLSDEDVSMDGCGSPRARRRRKQKALKEKEKIDRASSPRPLDEILYDDNLPEHSRLVEITSNIWGTKFKMIGLNSSLPSDLGQVIYKTSLLHLQPRQMTVTVTELGNNHVDLTDGSMQNGFSEEEEDITVTISDGFQPSLEEPPIDIAIPIVPEICVSPPQPRSQSIEELKHATFQKSPSLDNGTVSEISSKSTNAKAETDNRGSVNSELNDSKSQGALSEGKISKTVTVADSAAEKGVSQSSQVICSNVNSKHSSGASVVQTDQESWATSDIGRLISTVCQAASSTSSNEQSLVDGANISISEKKGNVSGSADTNPDVKEKTVVLKNLQNSVQSNISKNSDLKTVAKNGKTKGKKYSADVGVLSTSPKHQVDFNLTQSQSLPPSPVRHYHQEGRRKSEIADIAVRKMHSPTHRNGTDSSDEDLNSGKDGRMDQRQYRDLETFQKAQLSKKMKKSRSKSDGDRTSCWRHRHIMHNKAPLWNENNQVYQLDFGGRVTQESAKNFQIEWQGKQVMQFGRIDFNAYTLDFQHPFCAVQAFSVALANVTQRLK